MFHACPPANEFAALAANMPAAFPLAGTRIAANVSVAFMLADARAAAPYATPLCAQCLDLK
ncbi:MAG: hypothetical protein J6I73_00260 [Treponema sp.]|nr:hypothetical protein [Treponema sp.]